jgi:type I restriction enzyme R subunit
MSDNQTPEQRARNEIDKKLNDAGWVVQEKNKIDWSASRGIAVKEYLTNVGPVDYVLFVDRKPVGVIEAKKDEEGHRLTVVEEQSSGYATSKLKYLNNDPLPFVYESTGKLTRFTDFRDPKPRSRLVFSYLRPETFEEYLKKRPLRERLLAIPELKTDGLRDCQITAISNLEESFKDNRPRALVQMATGSGKTYTAITFIYRLLKFADAKKVLFLVDTRNLGEQAEQEFQAYMPNDDSRKFTELYNVQRLRSSYVPSDSQVCISTIQRLYSILKGEELDEKTEEENPAEEREWKQKEPLPVVYNEKVPIEEFDFIVIDECHRSIYNVWQQVLDYFDAFLIGLTATPDKRTFGFFNENVVSEYSHEEAVADGVNVGYDVYTIETEITKNGAKISAQEFVDRREKLTRKKRWEQLDEDYAYTAKKLDKDVVNPSQIRRVIRTFKENLPEIFPGREEVPKTLIFAKNDSHADDIINIVREEFGEGNAFCKKVTYKAEEDPKSVLADFRNLYNPRIAVTVDMIATGTDLKPLECLLFIRDVKSRNYFEQMKGRGTRTLGYDDLKKVTPSAVSAKTHFVIVDAVGVTKTLKTDSRPLERKKSTSLKDLLAAVTFGARDEDLYVSLASRLARLNRQISEDERAIFAEKANGKTVNQTVKDLLNAYNPDIIDLKASENKLRQPEVSDADAKKKAQEILIDIARSTFSGELNDYLENVRRVHEQIIDTVNLDTLKRAEWDKDAVVRADELVNDFKAYLEANKDEITALRIFYNQPYLRREVTFTMIKEVLEKLKLEKPHFAPLRVWQAYEQLEKVHGNSPKEELTALVSLIRRITEIDPVLTAYDQTVNRNFQDWVFKKQAGTLKFTEDQMNWLRMIKDYVATSFHLEIDDLDYTPFDALGGRGRMYQLFGDEMNTMISELNEALAA